MAVKIQSDVCRGCRMCMRGCRFRAIEMRDGKAFINEKCKDCGLCVQACPMGAIVKE